LAAAIVILALPLVFFAGLGVATSDNALGQEYAELLQAVRRPGMYRLFTTLDAVAWLMIGGTLLVLASTFARRAPVRATFLAACGIGQLTGSLGGFLRLDGIGDLATRYTTVTADQQVILLQSYLDLERVIGSHFHAGQLLQGMGFLLAAWMAFSWTGFPRWLAVGLAFPGLTSLTMFVLGIAGSFFFPLLLVHIVVGIIALHFAMAAGLWRWSPAASSLAAGHALTS
jgi:hypothetical protein